MRLLKTATPRIHILYTDYYIPIIQLNLYRDIIRQFVIVQDDLPCTRVRNCTERF